MLIREQFTGCPLTLGSLARNQFECEVNGGDELHFQYGKREMEKLPHSTGGGGWGWRFSYPQSTRGMFSKGKPTSWCIWL